MFFNRMSTYGDTVESLKIDIRFWGSRIKRHPDDHNTFHLKAAALMKIFQLTEEENYLNGALDCYNQAIRIVPEYASYIVDRATCYINLKQNDLAATDLEKVKSLLPMVDDPIESGYIVVEMEKIEQYLSSNRSSFSAIK